MKKFIVLALIALAFSSQEDDDYKEFQEFVRKYDKHYVSIEEYINRYVIFKENMEIIRENRMANEEMTWTEGVNEFSDLTEQEFRKYYLTLDYDMLDKLGAEPMEEMPEVNAPDTWNWVEKGVLNPIKNQGQCGSCWAFSVIANIESTWYIKKKEKYDLSEQMLVDCDTTNYGCDGGNRGKSLTWIKNNGGLMKQHDYPYAARRGRCEKNPSKYVPGLKLKGYRQAPQNENDMKALVYSVGPLSVSVNATPLQRYTGGIANYSQSQCPHRTNHAVNLVGYGHDSATKLDYWLVRNSWGTGWGEKGYFRISRGKGTCGINLYTTFAEFA